MQRTLDRTLIILVTNYPYGFGEHFMENELFALADEFSDIYIVATDQKYLGSKIKISRIPENVQLIEYIEKIDKKDKIFALRNLFSRVFFQDILTLRKCNIAICKIFLMEFLKAQKLSNFLDTLIQRQKINTHKCYVYSYWNDFMSASIAHLKIKYPKIKGFSRAHGWDVYSERHPFCYLPMRKFISSKLQAIFFISKNGKSYYQKLLPNYSSIFLHSPLGTTNETIFVNKNNETQSFVMVSCSSIIPLKNLWIMIDALSIISNTTIHWIHFGDGIEEQEIKKYAETKLKDKSNIDYLFKGFVSNSNVHRYYSNNHIDFLINCSTTEGIPVSMMEAMSFGIPVIGTNVGGVSEIIEHGENGYLLSPTPLAQEVANAIEKLCNLPHESMQALRANAYNTWNTKFNAETNYSRFIESIKAL